MEIGANYKMASSDSEIIFLKKKLSNFERRGNLIIVIYSHTVATPLCFLVLPHLLNCVSSQIPHLKNKPDPNSNPNLTKRYCIKTILGKILEKKTLAVAGLNRQLAASKNARNALDKHATGTRRNTNAENLNVYWYKHIQVKGSADI
jgi:hypothetical protein